MLPPAAAAQIVTAAASRVARCPLLLMGADDNDRSSIGELEAHGLEAVFDAGDLADVAIAEEHVEGDRILSAAPLRMPPLVELVRGVGVVADRARGRRFDD